MKIPSDDFCRNLFDRYAVPETIRRHCDKVAKVGTFLAEKLRDTGVEVYAACR